MTQEEIKNNFSQNLINLRKNANLTQAKLAQSLNYSDKAVSKWEVGAVLPEIETLVNIADFFNVTVNDLIYKKTKPAVNNSKTKYVLISLLSCALVMFISTLTYFILQVTTDLPRLWLCFVVAIPVCFIVLVVFTSIWFKKIWQCLAASGLIWSLIGTIYAFYNPINFWFIFVVGASLQVLVVLWYVLKIYLSKRKTNKV